eukprot:SAG11_NODE_9626_length_895_cov_0.876884_1_plen_216_part_01
MAMKRAGRASTADTDNQVLRLVEGGIQFWGAILQPGGFSKISAPKGVKIRIAGATLPKSARPGRHVVTLLLDEEDTTHMVVAVDAVHGGFSSVDLELSGEFGLKVDGASPVHVTGFLTQPRFDVEDANTWRHDDDADVIVTRVEGDSALPTDLGTAIDHDAVPDYTSSDEEAKAGSDDGGTGTILRHILDAKGEEESEEGSEEDQQEDDNDESREE